MLILNIYIYIFVYDFLFQSLVINKDELNGTTNSRLHAATSVTTITSKGLVITSHHTTGNIQTVGRAASWAVSFDKLLQDKVGITIFTVSRGHV